MLREGCCCHIEQPWTTCTVDALEGQHVAGQHNWRHNSCAPMSGYMCIQLRYKRADASILKDQKAQVIRLQRAGAVAYQDKECFCRLSAADLEMQGHLEKGREEGNQVHAMDSSRSDCCLLVASISCKERHAAVMRKCTEAEAWLHRIWCICRWCCLLQLRWSCLCSCAGLRRWWHASAWWTNSCRLGGSFCWPVSFRSL